MSEAVSSVQKQEDDSREKPREDELKEIYTYQAPWMIYGMGWCQRADKKFRLAIGSFVEEYSNVVQIIQLDEKSGKFEKKSEFDHPYPCTKIQWIPDKDGTCKDLLATSADYLRIWKVDENDCVKMTALLNNNKKSCGPLTSFDWNAVDPTILGTSSIDTTCTIWNVEQSKAITQLIAHDKEVYDLAFAPLPFTDVFASVGADGSLRVFDLRALEYSTILYESPGLQPLLRLAWNQWDPNYIATFMQDSCEVIILDTRSPSVPVSILQSHTHCVNAMAWAPHSASHIATGADDLQALIWSLDVPEGRTTVANEPILAYSGESEINSLQWSSAQPEWMGVAFDDKVQILRV